MRSEGAAAVKARRAERKRESSRTSTSEQEARVGATRRSRWLEVQLDSSAAAFEVPGNVMPAAPISSQSQRAGESRSIKSGEHMV